MQAVKETKPAKEKKKKKTIQFLFKQIIINGSLDCIANSLRPTMICDLLQK